MDFDEIKRYWDERAASDSTAQSTTQDVYLREIEARVVGDMVRKRKPATVMDVGCGDARTTARVALQFAGVRFFGGDYAESMVKNARAVVTEVGAGNVEVFACDVMKPLPKRNLDMIYSTRCLINLPTWEEQQTALNNIAEALAPGGCYVMIENFIEGQDNFNRVRQAFGLPPIAVRSHNRFFERQALLDFVSDKFDIAEEMNISSTYYLVSRVIYSKICQDQNAAPDYFDAHHKYGAQLPFTGEFGPVRAVCMVRKG